MQGLRVFAMMGMAEHYEDESGLSKYYDYEPIVPATKGKFNGLRDARKCPAACRAAEPRRPAHQRESSIGTELRERDESSNEFEAKADIELSLGLRNREEQIYYAICHSFVNHSCKFCFAPATCKTVINHNP